jgi:BASS family bile acid:Na+ symporter
MSFTTIIGVVIAVSVFMTVLGFGMRATFTDATYLFKNPALLFRALLGMNLIMPLFVGLLTWLFPLEPVVIIVLIALSVSPVPPILPGKALKSGGRRSYTLGLLTASSLLSVVLVPLTLEIFERAFEQSVSFRVSDVASTIFIGVISPLLLGLSIRLGVPELAEKGGGFIGRLALVLLIAAMLPVVFVLLPAVWQLIGNGAVLAIAAFVIFGITIGHVLGGPDPDDRTVLALSVSKRHPGIAMAIAGVATTAVGVTQAPAVILLYLILGVAVGGPYLKWLGRRSGESQAPSSHRAVGTAQRL